MKYCSDGGKVRFSTLCKTGLILKKKIAALDQYWSMFGGLWKSTSFGKLIKDFSIVKEIFFLDSNKFELPSKFDIVKSVY